MNINELFDQALQLHRSGRFAEAEALYLQILDAQPDIPDVLHLLAVIAFQTGQHDKGFKLIRRAVSLKPNFPEAWLNLGNAHKEKRQLAEAIIAYRLAIAHRPDYSEAHSSLGLALVESGETDQAIAACRTAIALNPNNADGHNNLGAALKNKGQFADAKAACLRALELNPSSAATYLNLGNLAVAEKRMEDASAAYHRAISLKPGYAEAFANLSFVQKHQGQLDEAIASSGRALELDPGSYDACNNLGIALKEKGQLDEAIAAFNRALDLKPDLAWAHNNLGATHAAAGRFEEAAAEYAKAIVLSPDYAAAHNSLAMAYLVRGDFLQGWKEYEWRCREDDYPAIEPPLAKPQWDGSSLPNGTIFLNMEQGFGDMIHMIRYVPMVAEKCRKIVISCPTELRRLFERMPGTWHWIPFGKAPLEFDVHCPLMSLPLAFATTIQTIPSNVPYLHADAHEREKWERRLAEDRARLKVGLVWAGRPTHKNDRNRSLPFSALEALFDVKGASFYSLQKGATKRRDEMSASGLQLLDYTNELDDFADTAALIANLDLVIAVDTAVAHLAGAMGKPVWTLLPFSPEWRWLLHRADSPWYPTMRLFRQPAIGDWKSVMRDVVEAMRKLIG